MENIDDRAAASPAVPEALAPLVLLYTLCRVGLVAALVAVMMLLLSMPFVVSLAFAIVIQLPLSMVLFTGLRRRLTTVIEARSAERRRLRAALRGDEA